MFTFFFSFLLCIRELVCVSLFDTKMMSLLNQINNEMSIYVHLAGSLHFEHLWKQMFDFFCTPLDKISILVILLTKCFSQKEKKNHATYAIELYNILLCLLT